MKPIKEEKLEEAVESNEEQIAPVETPEVKDEETSTEGDKDAPMDDSETKTGALSDDEIKEIVNTPIQENYRECSCGALVLLPDGSTDEPSICECGIKHIR